MAHFLGICAIGPFRQVERVYKPHVGTAVLSAEYDHVEDLERWTTTIRNHKTECFAEAQLHATKYAYINYSIAIKP